jgi:uncharacterized damage-inducible protein DinB
MIIKDFLDEYARYRLLAEKAIAQVPDDALNRVPAPEGNSVAMLVRHMSGNLASRFSDFLTSDGEKPWRDRDTEFETRDYTRAELDGLWARGWNVLETQVAALTDADLATTVTIREKPLTVHEALCRSLAHMAYHVGQIVLLARMTATSDWQWLSIPKGTSQSYNQNPTLEKRPH